MSTYETGVRQAIDNFLLEEASKIRDYGEYWSASQAGYCMRKVIFDRMGLPPVKEDARKQRVFTVGHIFHEWIQGITKQAGLSVMQEAELKDEDLKLLGHIDDLIKTDGKLILYDYKTQNSRAFTYMKQRGNKMSHYNRMQLGTYMYMLRKNVQSLDKPIVHPRTGEKTAQRLAIHTADLSEARILKISKDDLRLAEQILEYTPELEKEVVEYWKTIQGYWNNKSVPKCTCADYENGFMAKPAYNPYYYNDEPCSIEYYREWKASKGKE